MNRRDLIKGFLFSPAIVGVDNIMKIKSFIDDPFSYEWIKYKNGYYLVQPFKQMPNVFLSNTKILEKLVIWQNYNRIISLESFKTTSEWIKHAQG